jgi:hypothetical protein
MRQFITILLVISLSWVTTGYACQMDAQKLVRAICCCHGEHAVEPHTDGEEAQRGSAEESPCCDTTVSSSVDQQNPAVIAATPVLDLPVFAALPAIQWHVAAPVVSFVSLPPPARGPPSAGTRTYLATARLRL